jgi:hypothetical protein
MERRERAERLLRLIEEEAGGYIEEGWDDVAVEFFEPAEDWMALVAEFRSFNAEVQSDGRSA